MCSCEEVAEVHEFAMVGILNIYNTPTVLATTYGLALDDYVVLGTNNSERDDLLNRNDNMNHHIKEMTKMGDIL